MNFKSSIIAGLCGLALVSTACSDENEYVPASAVNTPEVYLSRLDDTEFTLVETDNEIDIPFYRLSDGAASSVTVEVTNPDASLFTVPTTVSFAEGEKTANLPISFNAKQLQGGVPYEITVKLTEGEDTPYYLTQVTYTLTYIPWEDYVVDGSNMALYTDDLIDALFGVDILTWEVPVQYSEYMPGVYRFADIYKQYSPYYGQGSFDEETSYLYINANDPNCVYFCDARGNAYDNTGWAIFYSGWSLSDDYGEFQFTGFYNYYMYKASVAESDDDAEGYQSDAIDNAGKFDRGIITFPESSLLVRIPAYSSGWYTGNENGGFKIVMPGVDENDLYDWEDLGTGQWTDGVVYPYYGEAPQTYDVQIQYFSDGETTLYKMLNPYKQGVMPDGLAYEDDKYIIFDASNPQCIKVDIQETGWIDTENNNGALSIINAASYLLLTQSSMTDETIIKNGYNDVLANNKITFAKGNLMYTFLDSPDKTVNSQLYDCEECVLALPAAAKHAKATAKKGQKKDLRTLSIKSNARAFKF
jgi:hypothetical protein